MSININKEHYAKIEKLAEEGNTHSRIAWVVFDCHPRTLRKIFARDEKAKAAYQRGRSKALGDMEQSIFERAKESDSLAIFYAKTQMRWKENSCEEITDLSIEEMKDAKKVFEAYASGRITSEKALEILSVIEKSQLVDIEDQLKIAALEKDLKA